jgi:ribosomal-protein-alanine N-acetyltransferase
MTVTIPAASLDLVLQTPGDLLAWVETLPPEVKAEVSPAWIERVRNTPPGDPFALGFNVVERSTCAMVGNCAFKAPPDADGVVEIAYGIDEEFRGRGFATQAAGALVDFALASGRVQLVIAHSRPDNGASARVLTKSGFRMIGEVVDPEDGLVCRWEHCQDAKG